jgi:hypothetical protein
MLLCSQLVFVLPALASQTPETTLLTNMIALRGTTMSPDDHAKAVESIYKSYDQAAPEEDRSDRLEQSLVDMKVG